MVFYVNCLCSQKSKPLSRMKTQSWGFLGSFCLDQAYNQGPSRSQTPCCAAPSTACSTASTTVSSSLHTPSFRQPRERADSNIFHILLLQPLPYRTVCLCPQLPHQVEHSSRTRAKSHLFNPRARTTTKQKTANASLLASSSLGVGGGRLCWGSHWNPGAPLHAEALRNSK